MHFLRQLHKDLDELIIQGIGVDLVNNIIMKPIILLYTLIPLLAAHPAELTARQDTPATPDTPQCFPDRTNCRICVPWGENGTACVNRGDVCCSNMCRYVPSRAVSRSWA